MSFSIVKKSIVLGCVGLFFSNVAFAKDAVVVPLYSPNLDAQKIGNITSLVTSEVDFTGRYDMVSQADARPKSLTPKCLKSVSCLRPIAAGEGVDAMITGSVTRTGGKLEFFIVQYENSKIIRMKRFQIEDNPLALAADVGSHVSELVTGKKLAEEEEDTVLLGSDPLDEEGDIFGEDPIGDFSLEEDTSAKEEQQRLEEQRRQEEEARRLVEEQRRMEEEAMRLAAEANAQKDDFDDFSFAPSTVEVAEDNSSLKDDGEMNLNLNDRPREEVREERRTPEPIDFESGRTKSRSTKKKTARDSEHLQGAASITGKVGGASFQGLNFVTYGGEIGVNLSDWVGLSISGEGFATQQTVPVLDDNGNETEELTREWRILLPVGIGAVVNFPGSIAKPYLGSKLHVLPGYAGPGSGMAFGLQGRAGSNFMITDSFGFNLDLSAGFWSGEYFSLIKNPATDTPLAATAFLPQLSVGTIITF